MWVLQQVDCSVRVCVRACVWERKWAEQGDRENRLNPTLFSWYVILLFWHFHKDWRENNEVNTGAFINTMLNWLRAQWNILVKQFQFIFLIHTQSLTMLVEQHETQNLQNCTSAITPKKVPHHSIRGFLVEFCLCVGEYKNTVGAECTFYWRRNKARPHKPQHISSINIYEGVSCSNKSTPQTYLGRWHVWKLVHHDENFAEKLGHQSNVLQFSNQRRWIMPTNKSQILLSSLSDFCKLVKSHSFSS